MILSQTRSSVTIQVQNRVWNQILDQAGDLMEVVGDRVWYQVRDQLEGQVRRQVEDHLRQEVDKW